MQTHHSARLRLIVAPFTPMGPDGAVQYDKIAGIAQALKADGISGAFLNGTTGEGMSLTLLERQKIAEAWREVCNDEFKLLVHVGHACLDDARELARHAQRISAHGIGAIGPIFFPATTADILFEYCRAIAEAAPALPFYYYHMPSMARVTVKASEVMPLLITGIPNFAGIKFTHDDIAEYRECLALAGGKYPVFFGRDELLLKAMEAGATVGLGSTYNFAAPLYFEMERQYRAGNSDEASRLQALCKRGIEIMVSHGGLAAIKATTSALGIDCGPARVPLRIPAKAEVQVMLRELDDIGYLSAIQALRKSSRKS